MKTFEKNDVYLKLFKIFLTTSFIVLFPLLSHATYMPGVGDWIAIFLVFGSIIGFIFSSLLTLIVFLFKRKSKTKKFYILLWVIPFCILAFLPSILLWGVSLFNF